MSASVLKKDANTQRFKKNAERNQKAEEKRQVFSTDLKEETEEECLTERRRGFQMTGPMY